MIETLIGAEHDRAQAQKDKEAAAKALDHKLRGMLLDQIWGLIHPEFNTTGYVFSEAPGLMVSDSSDHDKVKRGTALIGRTSTHCLRLYSYRGDEMWGERAEERTKYRKWARTFDGFYAHLIERPRDSHASGDDVLLPYPLRDGELLWVKPAARGGYAYHVRSMQGYRVETREFLDPVEAVSHLMTSLAPYLTRA